MSKVIHKVADFLRLLLNTTKKQVRALFYTLSPAQIFAICEILFNIQKLPLPGRILSELKKRRGLFRKLSDKTLSLEKKLTLIETHYRQIYTTLLLVKKEILRLLE